MAQWAAVIWAAAFYPVWHYVPSGVIATGILTMALWPWHYYQRHFDRGILSPAFWPLAFCPTGILSAALCHGILEIQLLDSVLPIPWHNADTECNTESKSWISKCLSNNSENPESSLEDTFPYKVNQELNLSEFFVVNESSKSWIQCQSNESWWIGNLKKWESVQDRKSVV